MADSSALITLATVDCPSVLGGLFGDVKAPKTAYDELTKRGKPQAAKLKEYLQNKVAQIEQNNIVLTSPQLGLGEIEAMILYKELNADALLVDDKKAKRVASANGIVTVGSIGVLIRAKQKGLLSQIKPLLDCINESQIYMSGELYKLALMEAGE